MAVLGPRFRARAFSICGKRGPLFIVVRGPLTIAASLVAEHRLQTRGLSSCGSRAQLLRGMWDPPRPGLAPMSPASAGRLSTTAPPGKPDTVLLIVVTMLYIRSPELSHLITGSLYPLTNISPFPHPYSPWQPPFLFSISMSLGFFYIPSVSEVMQRLSFCLTCFTHHTTGPSGEPQGALYYSRPHALNSKQFQK